jgi:methylthioribose-1-phosphate isomerase
MTRGLTPLKFSGAFLRLLDQLALPARETWITCRDYRAVGKAIFDMNVRGAPAIGCTAAYGMALAARNSRAQTPSKLLADLRTAGDYLISTRPTAVNLKWAVDRVLGKARASALRGDSPARIRAIVTADARSIEAEDLAANRRMGALGATLFKKRGNILTHCNTGALATAGIGTALGVIRAVHARGRLKQVFVDETRPYLQGARLTAWELKRDRIPYVLITDNMAGYFMQKGEIGAVIVGADRITAHGDVANKIGTYSLSVLARHHGIPFYVAAPVSTVDLKTLHGSSIKIEERSTREVVQIGKTVIAPVGTKARHPAFDVAPGRLVTAIITERGIARPPYIRSLKRLMGVK